MLYENVKELCKKNNITFAHLERKLEFGNGTVRKWEVASPSVERLEKVADYFGVTTDWLLGRVS
ncbi:helix-turn-helix domain-containing protein [Clostridium merdae]|uniref:helix-turn-helix domain-containing protein n=1 Tax=Clostridium merdae TaxID=1958780 RepID=UPI000A2721FC|nr:helix-turn-helix transcriptional regulator [Clostridium merdae]